MELLLRVTILFIILTLVSGCESIKEFMGSVPAVSYTDEHGKTVGRACEKLEAGGQVCTNTLPNGDKAVTTYNAEGKITDLKVIKKPLK